MLGKHWSQDVLWLKNGGVTRCKNKEVMDLEKSYRENCAVFESVTGVVTYAEMIRIFQG